MARTPKFSLWLLRTIGSGDSIEALIGDLIEERERGRGRWWFWWQVFVATITFAFRDLRLHKALAIRGIVIGWTVFIGLVFVAQKFAILPLVNVRDSNFNYGLFLLILLSCIPRIAAGWIVAKLHQPHGFAVAIGLAGSFFVGDLALMVAMTISGVASMSIWIILRALAVAVTGTVAGGLWGSRSESPKNV